MKKTSGAPLWALALGRSKTNGTQTSRNRAYAAIADIVELLPHKMHELSSDAWLLANRALIAWPIGQRFAAKKAIAAAKRLPPSFAALAGHIVE